MTRLRTRLRGDEVIHAASAWDGLSGLAARRSGCTGVVVSGASVAASRLGLPDLGFLGVDDVVAATRAVVRTCGLPVLVDIDTGFGNAATAVRAADLLAEVGAAGVIVEDQVSPKRCGLLPKDVVEPDVAAAVVRELARRRPHDDFVIVARTDALAVRGAEDAASRVRRYVAEGADLWYLQGASSADLRSLELPRDTFGFHPVTGGVPAVKDAQWRDLGVRWVTHAAVGETAAVSAVGAALAANLVGEPADATFDARRIAHELDAEHWMGMGAGAG